MGKVSDLLDRSKKLVNRRREWDDWYQALTEMFLPNQADFTSRQLPGKRRDLKNFENTHRIAARNFATTLDGLMKPKTAPWFEVGVDDEELMENDEVKLWTEMVQLRMWRAIYSSGARFVQASSETDFSLVVLGTGVLWISENPNRDGMMFKSFHLRDIAIDENSRGQVDTLSLCTKLTKRQAIQRFGEANLGAKVREDMSSEQSFAEKKFEFIQLILPRDDRDARKIDSRNMPFSSVILDVESEHIISESGFQEFPAAVPRWDTTPEEVYGRSPAMLAFSDTRTLQAIAKTLLLGGQRAVDPPTWVLNDAAASTIRTFPGGVSVLDAQAVTATGGRPPIGVLDMGKNIPLGRDIQQDYRQLVQAAFFNDLFVNSVEGRDVTATEILERKEQLVRVLGPTFGRLEDDYIGVIINRTFNIMDRAGAFPERPQVLQGRPVSFSYMSPAQQARKTTEAAGLLRAMETLGPLASVQPEMLDNFDGDEIARDTPNWAGFPQRYMRTQGAVDELRGQRAQAQQDQQIAEQATQAGAATRDFALAEQALSQSEEEAA